MNRLKPLEHRFKAFFFNLFKSTLKKGQKDFKPLDGIQMKRVLFLRPEKIGDMIISLPVFDGLSQRFPHIKIAILGSPTNYGIIKDDPRFDEIYLYTKNVPRDIRTLMAMRRGNYDCVVDMIGNDSVTALFLSQMCAPGKPRIGVGKVKFREYYDFNYDHRLGNTGHIIENTLKILNAFDIDSDKISGYAEPYIKEEADARARAFFEQINGGNREALKIGYNLSAGSVTRVWAQEKSIELLRKISSHTDGGKIILFTIPSERKRALVLKEKLGDGVELVPDKLNLIEAAAVIRYLDLLISPDTSLVHIARSMKVPVVGLYSRYMKNFLLWRPYGQEKGAVVSGCDGNIFDITVDQVMETFTEVINNRKAVRG